MATKASRYRMAPPARLDARTAPRHCVAIAQASVRPHGRWPADATLIDLSIYGARLASPLDHQPGDRIWLRFAGGMQIAATTIWAAEGTIGCRFDLPIDTGTVRALSIA